MKKFLIVIPILILVAWVFTSPKRTNPPVVKGKVVVTVQITAKGFSPASITIKKGQAVEWVNDDTEIRWPASDPHPLHNIYPEFDPKQPIYPGEKWSFTFERIGKWGYHDHTFPVNTGSVSVVD